MCGKKDYSLVYKEILFLVKEVMHSKEKSLISRQYCKEFDGFDPRVLPMGRGKIKHETKREKMDFWLGGTQEKWESKVLPPLRR